MKFKSGDENNRRENPQGILLWASLLSSTSNLTIGSPRQPLFVSRSGSRLLSGIKDGFDLLNGEGVRTVST
jgi:hypothetical protein